VAATEPSLKSVTLSVLCETTPAIASQYIIMPAANLANEDYIKVNREEASHATK